MVEIAFLILSTSFRSNVRSQRDRIALGCPVSESAPLLSFFFPRRHLHRAVFVLALLFCILNNENLVSATGCTYATGGSITLQLAVTAGQEICLPFTRASLVSLNIQWGDSSPMQTVLNNQTACATSGLIGVSHVYADAASVSVVLQGTLDHFGTGVDVNSLAWGDALVGVSFSGSTGLVSLAGAFVGATQPFTISNIPCGVKDLSWAFYTTTTFNHPIGDWDTSAVTSMEAMFWYAFAFNQDISRWDTSNVLTMNRMFLGASAFQRDLRMWCVGKATDDGYFDYGHTTGILNPPDFGSCATRIATSIAPSSQAKITLSITTSAANTLVCFPFARATSANFQVDYGDGTTVFDVFRPNITCASSLIRGISHLFIAPGDYVVRLSGSLQHFGAGDTSSSFAWGDVLRSVQFVGDMGLQNLAGAFVGATSDFDISPTLPSRVKDLSWAFYNAQLFNRPIGGWDTSLVTSMEGMFFYGYAFNQDISRWDTSNVVSMNRMFLAASAFQRDLRMWCVGKVTDADYFDYAHTTGILNPPDFGNCATRVATTIVSPTGPRITLNITTTAPNTVVCFPFSRATYANFQVNYGDGTTVFDVFRPNITCFSPAIRGISHLFIAPGDYVVRLSGSLQHFGAGEPSTSFSWGDTLQSVQFVGDMGLQNLAGAFMGANANFDVSPTLPSRVRDLSWAFYTQVLNTAWDGFRSGEVVRCTYKCSSKTLQSDVTRKIQAPQSISPRKSK
jgi:surface protein